MVQDLDKDKRIAICATGHGSGKVTYEDVPKDQWALQDDARGKNNRMAELPLIEQQSITCPVPPPTNPLVNDNNTTPNPSGSGEATTSKSHVGNKNLRGRRRQ